VSTRTKISEEAAVPFTNVTEITNTLVRRFGHSSLGNKRNPFNELLYIILSSKTPPERYTSAYRELKRRYPRFESLAEAEPQEVALTIKFAGLEGKKALQIVQSARQLKRLFGRVSLRACESIGGQLGCK
jgi:endonuclease III